MPTGTSDGTVLLASADARYRQFPFHCSDWAAPKAEQRTASSGEDLAAWGVLVGLGQAELPVVVWIWAR